MWTVTDPRTSESVPIARTTSRRTDGDQMGALFVLWAWSQSPAAGGFIRL